MFVCVLESNRGTRKLVLPTFYPPNPVELSIHVSIQLCILPVRAQHVCEILYLRDFVLHVVFDKNYMQHL